MDDKNPLILQSNHELEVRSPGCQFAWSIETSLNVWDNVYLKHDMHFLGGFKLLIFRSSKGICCSQHYKKHDTTWPHICYLSYPILTSISILSFYSLPLQFSFLLSYSILLLSFLVYPNLCIILYNGSPLFAVWHYTVYGSEIRVNYLQSVMSTSLNFVICHYFQIEIICTIAKTKPTSWVQVCSKSLENRI